jgi:hypothetical protein
MPFHFDGNLNLGGAGQINAAAKIGDDIRKWREEREQTEKEIGFADTVMKSAHADGRVSDEEYTDYLKMPANKKHSAALGQMANVADDFKRQQLAETILARRQIAEERNRPWSPSPETLKWAQEHGIAVLETSPHSVEYRDPNKNTNIHEPGSPAYDGAGNEIGVWEKGDKIKTTQKTKSDPMAAMLELQRTNEISGIDRQIADLQAELAKGNQKTGPDWNPLAEPYSDKLRGLLAKRAALSATGGRQPAAAPSMEAITGQQPLPGATTTPNVTAPAASSTAPVINNEADYAAIPAGGMYVDARDGKLKRKKAAQ